MRRRRTKTNRKNMLRDRSNGCKQPPRGAHVGYASVRYRYVGTNTCGSNTRNTWRNRIEVRRRCFRGMSGDMLLLAQYAAQYCELKYGIKMQRTTQNNQTHPNPIRTSGCTQDIAKLKTEAVAAARYAKSTPSLVMDPLIIIIQIKQTIITTITY